MGYRPKCLEDASVVLKKLCVQSKCMIRKQNDALDAGRFDFDFCVPEFLVAPAHTPSAQPSIRTGIFIEPIYILSNVSLVSKYKICKAFSSEALKIVSVSKCPSRASRASDGTRALPW